MMAINRSRTFIAAIVFVFLGTTGALGIEEANYQVVTNDNNFEVRDYAPYLLAEIVMTGDLEEVGGKAFKRLYKYISGDNNRQEKIAMTAPVGQERVGEGWAVSFVMPGSYTLESLPAPDDPEITFRQRPGHRVAAIRYSGFWSGENYKQHLAKLNAWIEKEGLSVVGDPIWARYDPPFMPWFMRRNEVLIPISGAPG